MLVHIGSDARALTKLIMAMALAGGYGIYTGRESVGIVGEWFQESDPVPQGTEHLSSVLMYAIRIKLSFFFNRRQIPQIVL